MTATATTPANRVAPYFDEPRKTLPPLPATPADRETLLTDAVFAAVAALQGLLAHHDPAVVLRAAEMILNLETTRQRHGRKVIGMEPAESTPHPPGAASDQPHPEGAESIPARKVNHANPLDVFVEKVRAELQSQEDVEGTGVIVSRAEAEECARFIQANMHDTPFPPAGLRCHGGQPEVRGTGGPPVSGFAVGLDSTTVRPDAIPRFPVPAAKECRPCPSPTRPLRPSACPTSSPATASPARAAAGGRTAPR